jgi:Vitamin K-dependent gamma-carboxylase
MIAGAARRLESRMYQSFAARPVDLAVYRVLYAACVLLQVVPTAAWLRHAPRAFFSPPIGLAALFTSFPAPFVITGLNALLALFVGMLLVGWRTSVASLGTGLTLLVLKSWEYSLGKINHDILLIIVPFVLAFSGWGDAFSFDAARYDRGDRARSWPLALLALLIGYGMFTAGWTKLSSGWLDPQTLSTYGHLLNNYRATGRETLAAARALRIDSFVLWKAGDWAATLLELSFLAAIVNREIFCVVMALATVFHLAVWLLFDISFWWNVLAYGAFVRYSELFPPLIGLATDKPVATRSLKAAFAVPFSLGSIATWFGAPLTSILHLPLDGVILVGGAVAGTVSLFNRAITFVRVHGGVRSPRCT